MKSKRPTLIILILLAVIAGLLYKFIFAGDTHPAPDGRSAIVLSPTERAQALAMMRDDVLAVQQIVQGLANGDMRQIEAGALPVGSRAMNRIDVQTLEFYTRELDSASSFVEGDMLPWRQMVHPLRLECADDFPKSRVDAGVPASSGRPGPGEPGQSHSGHHSQDRGFGI